MAVLQTPKLITFGQFILSNFGKEVRLVKDPAYTHTHTYVYIYIYNVYTHVDNKEILRKLMNIAGWPFFKVICLDFYSVLLGSIAHVSLFRTKSPVPQEVHGGR